MGKAKRYLYLLFGKTQYDRAVGLIAICTNAERAKRLEAKFTNTHIEQWVAEIGPGLYNFARRLQEKEES